MCRSFFGISIMKIEIIDCPNDSYFNNLVGTKVKEK
jgi:hypothetical protein